MRFRMQLASQSLRALFPKTAEPPPSVGPTCSPGPPNAGPGRSFSAKQWPPSEPSTRTVTSASLPPAPPGNTAASPLTSSSPPLPSATRPITSASSPSASVPPLLAPASHPLVPSCPPLTAPPAAQPLSEWSPPLIPIIYEDEHFLAVAKPGGIMVHFSREAPPEDRLRKAFLKDLVEQQHNGGRSLFPVHRLDRAASGVLLLARSSAACAAAQRAMALPTAMKRYTVLCRGCPPREFVCDDPMKDEKGVLKEARTECTNVQHFASARCSHLSVRIRTGRRHQIRRHLNYRGFHVIGDSVHGKGRDNKMFREAHALPPARMFLHASALHLELASLPDTPQAIAQASSCGGGGGDSVCHEGAIRPASSGSGSRDGASPARTLSLYCPLPADLMQVLESVAVAEGVPPGSIARLYDGFRA